MAESQALLIDQCGLDLTPANIAQLEDSTDGWAAALQLASLSLRGRPPTQPHSWRSVRAA